MPTAETECFNGTGIISRKIGNTLYGHRQMLAIGIKLKELDHIFFMIYSDKLFQVKWLLMVF